MNLKYTIQQGDTLSEIADNLGLDMAELAEVNGIEDANKIYAGKKLTVPSRQKQEEEKVRAVERSIQPQEEPSPPQRREPLQEPKQPEAVEKGLVDRALDFFITPSKAATKPSLLAGPEPKPKTVSKQSTSSSFIPENAKAFGRFLAGNIFGSEKKGDDIDVASFGEDQKKVLKTAMRNASRDGRSYITYSDYPEMKGGENVNDFYQKKREDNGLFDLARASFTDPVFEMFTTLGVFSFDKKGDNYTILPDKYDFDKSKSGGDNRPEAKDSYSSLTYLGQDISEDQSYSFNIRGVI